MLLERDCEHFGEDLKTTGEFGSCSAMVVTLQTTILCVHFLRFRDKAHNELRATRPKDKSARDNSARRESESFRQNPLPPLDDSATSCYLSRDQINFRL